jgi:hypothetical protein
MECSKYIDYDFLEGLECHYLLDKEVDFQYLRYGGCFQVHSIHTSPNRMKIIYAYIAENKFNKGIDYNTISNEEKLILNKTIINTIKYLTYKDVQDYLELYSLKELKKLCYLNHIPDSYIVNKKYKGNWALSYKRCIPFSKEVFCYHFYNNHNSKLYGNKDILKIIYNYI